MARGTTLTNNTLLTGGAFNQEQNFMKIFWNQAKSLSPKLAAALRFAYPWNVHNKKK